MDIPIYYPQRSEKFLNHCFEEAQKPGHNSTVDLWVGGSESQYLYTGAHRVVLSRFPKLYERILINSAGDHVIDLQYGVEINRLLIAWCYQQPLGISMKQNHSNYADIRGLLDDLANIADDYEIDELQEDIIFIYSSQIAPRQIAHTQMENQKGQHEPSTKESCLLRVERIFKEQNFSVRYGAFGHGRRGQPGPVGTG